jgi:hypothetical protein
MNLHSVLRKIPIPPESIKYAKVPVGEPAAPPPEGTFTLSYDDFIVSNFAMVVAIHDLLRRGTIIRQHLTGHSLV